jgi:hypothetical protein
MDWLFKPKPPPRAYKPLQKRELAPPRPVRDLTQQGQGWLDFVAKEAQQIVTDMQHMGTPTVNMEKLAQDVHRDRLADLAALLASNHGLTWFEMITLCTGVEKDQAKAYELAARLHRWAKEYLDPPPRLTGQRIPSPPIPQQFDEPHNDPV